MRKADSVLVGLITLFAGCTGQPQVAEVVGDWQFAMDIGNEHLPFSATIVEEDGRLQFYVRNGEETIRADEFHFQEDSIVVRMPVFNTSLVGKLQGEQIKGTFFDNSRKDNYQIPFVANRNVPTRFPITSSPTVNVTGKWRVAFSPGSDNQYDAIGIFQQEDHRATGTFLTTTGDYRYLEGNVVGDSLLLSCFDGSHAFLFKARVQGSKIFGDFWSGTHWQENWAGERDEAFELPDPNTLTFLKPGYDRLSFAFPDLEGTTVSLEDEHYRNKVVVVQIMGSWCPNCMDETSYLVELHKKFHDQGFEVISLAFEKSDNQETNIRSLKRLQEHFDVPYRILLAGKASKTEAAEKLPMLNHVLSFPTSIFIDRKGEVRRIHTGFSGPGTGEYYKEFVEETDRFVTQLLIE
ncbi:MAG: TlpA family protein disulfide reductase [Bacteroidetes bacterium]|nr:MAG: TlpA family protein disulfide reductase [Bacteroidota bacterium]